MPSPGQAYLYIALLSIQFQLHLGMVATTNDFLQPLQNTELTNQTTCQEQRSQSFEDGHFSTGRCSSSAQSGIPSKFALVSLDGLVTIQK